MKKMLLALVLLIAPSFARADESLLDQIYAGFVGRAKLAIETNTHGDVQPEFLVNYVEIGQLKGDYIFAIDSGALGTILPDHFDAVDWTTGGKLHLAPIFKNFVHLPDEWKFIGNMEIDARASYNWTAHHPYYGLVAAYPFK